MLEGSEGKESACNARDKKCRFNPLVRRSPGEGNGNPQQCFPGKPHGQRSLVGYSLKGYKELDLTE